MKTLRQEDGRRSATTSRKWIHMPTTGSPRAFMCHLICVSSVFLCAHFSSSSPAVLPGNKEAPILMFYRADVFRLQSDALKNRRLTALKKDSSRPVCFYPTIFQKKHKCCWLKASEIKKIQMDMCLSAACSGCASTWFLLWLKSVCTTDFWNCQESKAAFKCALPF